MKKFRLNLIKRGKLVLQRERYTKPLITNPDIYIAEQRVKTLIKRKERS